MEARVIEKRIRKFARLNKIFSKGDKILVVGKLALHVVRSIVGKMPATVEVIDDMDYVELVLGNGSLNTKGFNKVVLPWTLDDEIVIFMEKFMSGKFSDKDTKWFVPVFEKNKIQYIKLFRDVSNEELVQFAKDRKVKYSPRVVGGGIKKMIEELKERYPESKHSLLHSIDELRLVLSK